MPLCTRVPAWGRWLHALVGRGEVGGPVWGHQLECVYPQHCLPLPCQPASSGLTFSASVIIPGPRLARMLCDSFPWPSRAEPSLGRELSRATLGPAFFLSASAFSCSAPLWQLHRQGKAQGLYIGSGVPLLGSLWDTTARYLGHPGTSPTWSTVSLLALRPMSGPVLLPPFPRAVTLTPSFKTEGYRP